MLYNSKLIALNGFFLHSIKYLKKHNKRSLKFNNSPLVAEQKNYPTFTIQIIGQKFHSETFSKTLKNCLFRATNIVKNNDKEKYAYSDYGIAFDGKGSGSFNNSYTKNL